VNRLRSLLLLLGLLAWLGVHTVPAWNLVFPRPGEVRFFEIDSYYHYRQTRALSGHYGTLSRRDMGTVYLERSQNLGGYDVMLATVCEVLGLGHGRSDRQVQLVMAWSPAICGLLLLLGLHLLARRLLVPWATASVIWLLLLFPGPLLGYSMLGFADHHAFEAMLAVLVCLSLARCLCQTQTSWRPAWLEALPLVLFFLSWNGAALYVLACAGAVACALALVPDEAPQVARNSTRYALAAFCMFAPLRLLRPDWMLSLNLACWILGGLLVWALLPVLVLRLARRKIGLAVLGGLALLGLAGLLSSGMATELMSQRQPLVSENLSVTWRGFFGHFGVVGLLALSAFPVAFCKRRDLSLGLAAVLGFTAFWLLLWSQTSKCGYVAPAFMALLAAWVLQTAFATVTSRPARAGLGIALLLALLVPFWRGWVFSPWPPPERLRALMIVNDDLIGAMAWLRASSPPLSYSVDDVAPSGKPPSEKPHGYGVFTAWDFGHLVPALAWRPVLYSGEPNAEGAGAQLETDEEALFQLLRPRRAESRRQRNVRYVVLEARSLAEFWPAAVKTAGLDLALYREQGPHPTFGPLYKAAVMARMYLEAGQGLRHFRRVYDSQGQRVLVYVADTSSGAFSRRSIEASQEGRLALLRTAAQDHALAVGPELWYGAEVLPTVRIFEVVEGARLVGASAPGSTVTARLSLIDGKGGQPFVYEQTVRAGAEGRFEMVVPYSTEMPAAGQFFAFGLYQVTGSRGVASVAVSQSQVEPGETVPVVFP
jgi:asparagine N-glycosylation enzyme membrane subunit Stt3